MPLETGITGIQDLNAAWPTGVDPKSEGDDHLRNIKDAVQLSFPNMTAPWTTGSQIVVAGMDASAAQINNLANGVADTDAATVGQVNSLITALEWELATCDNNGTIKFQTGGITMNRVGAGQYAFTFSRIAAHPNRQIVLCQAVDVFNGRPTTCGYAAPTTTGIQINLQVYTEATSEFDYTDNDFHLARAVF